MSEYLVHMTDSLSGLVSILHGNTIEARRPYGGRQPLLRSAAEDVWRRRFAWPSWFRRGVVVSAAAQRRVDTFRSQGTSTWRPPLRLRCDRARRVETSGSVAESRASAHPDEHPGRSSALGVSTFAATLAFGIAAVPAAILPIGCVASAASAEHV